VEEAVLVVNVVTIAELQAAWENGIAISDNDLWIAATASMCRSPLVTCDRDHVRIAPELGGEVLYLAPPV
jgi:predicted nucleic acid-binding protein